MKACTACGLDKPLDDFAMNRSGADGCVRRQSHCKPCRKERRKERYERRELIKAGLVNPWVQDDILTALAENARRAERRKAIVRRSYEQNGRDYQRAYRIDNAARLKARDQAYYQANKEQYAARERLWRAANPERARERVAQWRAANREIYLASARLSAERRRAAMEASAIGPITTELLSARFALFGGLCWICKTAPWEAIDHVKPLSKGGPHILANLRPACKPCNSRKKDRWPFPEAL